LISTEITIYSSAISPGIDDVVGFHAEDAQELKMAFTMRSMTISRPADGIDSRCDKKLMSRESVAMIGDRWCKNREFCTTYGLQ
jgi:hypothetical protein